MTYKTKRWLYRSCFLLILILVIAGCGCTSKDVEEPVEKADKIDKIVISSPFSPLVMPMAYIVENNMLDEVANDVELVIWNNPDQLRIMMTQDDVHFVSVPSNVASIFYNKGTDLKLLEISVWGVFYVISSNTSVQSLHDLTAQEVYVPFKGDQPDLVFRYICQQQGIDPFKDLEIQYVSSPLDLTLNLLAGTAEYAVTLEPGASQAIRKAQENGITIERVIDIQEEWGSVTGTDPRLPNAGVVALPGILENPIAIEAFCKAYDEGVKWSNQNPHEAAILAAKYVEGVDAAAFEEALNYTIFESVPARDSKKELEFMYSCFMDLEPDSIGGKLPDEEFYYKYEE